MRSRYLLLGAASVAIAGSALLILTWTGAIEWQYGESIGFWLVTGALYLMALAIVDGIRSIRSDIVLIRERTKNAAANTTRAAERIEEIRQEIYLGPIAHLPGQVGRLEGWLYGKNDGESPRRQRAEAPSPDSEFDAVFLLNLDVDEAKRAHAESMLSEHGIAFTRFAAIDGNDAAFDQEWLDYTNRPLSLPAERRQGTRLIESRGAWGYLKTMQALLEYAKDRGLGRILVLEDDVMLHRDFLPRFAEAWTELPANWKLIYLGSAQVDRAKVTRFSDHLYHPGAMANGSYAIAVDDAVFDQALAAISRFDWPFDAGALREIDASYPTEVFAVDPPLVIADVSQSAIRPRRDMDAHVAKHGWTLAEYEDPPRY